MKVNTVHSKDEQGRQVTERIVEQGAVEYRFRVTPDGHAYQGDGDPPDTAIEALEPYEDTEGDEQDGEEQ